MTPPSSPVVECVPNFSEGEDRDVLDAIVAAAGSANGAAVLDVDPDPWHARTVLTLAGPAPAAAEAAFRAVQAAVERIDLTRHSGEHPRIGAADVVPFVPLDALDLGSLQGGGMELCVDQAEATGRRIAEELDVPVFLYGEAARRPERTVPAPFRKGGFETLRERIGSDPERAPDYGPRAVHPTAGATAVGARRLLVAYNVYLDSDDVEVARRIARRIRESGGGLPAVQALGFAVEGRAQVSTNLLDVDRTGPDDVFRAVSERAAREGVGVWRSEIVGLAPERALPPDPEERIRLRGSAAEAALERRLREALERDGQAGG